MYVLHSAYCLTDTFRLIADTGERKTVSCPQGICVDPQPKCLLFFCFLFPKEINPLSQAALNTHIRVKLAFHSVFCHSENLQRELPEAEFHLKVGYQKACSRSERAREFHIAVASVMSHYFFLSKCFLENTTLIPPVKKIHRMDRHCFTSCPLKHITT